MSRTYRKIMEWKYDAYGRLWTNDELDAEGLGSRYVRVQHRAQAMTRPGDPGFLVVYVTPGLRGRGVLNRRGRDKKQRDKPPKRFKQVYRRVERARMAQALAQGRDLPVFKRSDQWNWT